MSKRAGGKPIPPPRQIEIDPQRPLPSMGRLDELITVQLRRVDIFMAQSFHATGQKKGVRSGLISSLALIVANPGVSQNEVGRFTGIDKSIMVGILDMLEEMGWAVREKSQQDRRRYALFATDAGKDALNQLVDSVKAVEMEMLGAVSSTDLAELHRILDIMFTSCIRFFARQ